MVTVSNYRKRTCVNITNNEKGDRVVFDNIEII